MSPRSKVHSYELLMVSLKNQQDSESEDGPSGGWWLEPDFYQQEKHGKKQLEPPYKPVFFFLWSTGF